MLGRLREYRVKSERHLTRYIRLVGHFKEYTGFGEFHHILPVSMWKDLKYNQTNLVKLPLKAHFIAHYLLWRVYRNEAMLLAFQQMCRIKGGRHHQSRLYQSCKEEFRKTLGGRKWWHNPSTGEVKLSKTCPSGFIEGTGRDPKDFIPKRLNWWHDPLTGRAFRVDSSIGPPPGAVKGRAGFNGGNGLKKIAGRVNKLDVVLKRQVSVPRDDMRWNLFPTTGVKIEDRVVIIWGGVKYLSWKNVPLEVPRNTNPCDVVKPTKGGPLSKKTREFREANQGKTFGSLGLRVERFIDHIFSEKDVISV